MIHISDNGEVSKPPQKLGYVTQPPLYFKLKPKSRSKFLVSKAKAVLCRLVSVSPILNV